MFFFFHLLAGIILGFLLADLLRDNRWILPCIIGSVLPDIIDKPLGLVLFPATIGDGRIFTHTLIIAAIILALGIYFWKTLKDPSLVALGIGLLSHQVLDSMWLMPSNWYYPFAGSFRGGLPDDYIWRLLDGEMQNSFDIGLAFILAGIVLLVIFHRHFVSIHMPDRKVSGELLALAALLLCALAGICIGWGIGNHKILQLGWGTPAEVIIGGIVFALAAMLVWRWQVKICREKKPE